MKTQKTQNELSAFKDGVFKDAFRKIFLLHKLYESFERLIDSIYPHVAQ